MFPSRQQARSWSRAIGWFSIGLGVAEFVAARPLARATGLHGRAALVRACGAREVANGVALLRAQRPTPWMWARVAGDAIDVAALASARRGTSAGALAAVGAVAALDVLCATRLAAPAQASAYDYSRRSGFPRPAPEMRGAALADFEPPRDMRTPEAMRPWAPMAEQAAMGTRTAADVMTRGVRAMSPDDSVQLAAQAMDELDVGVIPVCERERVVGLVTDRDIALRAVAQGLSPERTALRDVMSPDVDCAREHDRLAEVAAKMERAHVRRLPVLDADDHLVGMLSLGDLAVKSAERAAGHTLADISQPAQPDRSFNSAASDAAGGGSAAGAPRGDRMP